MRPAHTIAAIEPDDWDKIRSPLPVAEAISKPTDLTTTVRTPRRLWGLYMELGKARLSMLVVLTTVMGFVLASEGAIDWARMAWTVLGTALAAFSANALNQIIETHRDAKMHRTAGRPLPSGRISFAHASAMALMAGGFGISVLVSMVNLLTAMLALGTVVLYVGVYTPLKTRSTLNTVVGAVVGAIPPLMGWSAVTGRLDTGAWILAAILLAWQIPHFLALAWMYRADYRRGGYVMLPSVDESGRITGHTVVLWTLALVPITCATSWIGLTGGLYAFGAVLLGMWFVKLAWGMYRQCDDQTARKLFLASVIYLPLLMGLMVVDRAVGVRPVQKATPSVAISQ